MLSSALLQTSLECLSLEREAERDECLAMHEALGAHALQQRGLALHRLRLLSVESGLFGRTLLTLQLPAARALPPTKFSSGAMVALRPASASAAGAVTGTVTALKETAVCVAFDEMPEEEQLVEPLTLSLMYNDVSYRRLEGALATLRDERAPVAAAAICGALLGEDGPPPPSQAITPIEPHQLHNPSLNKGQREAVAFELGTRPIALIHGPPGTGKTTAVVELIQQAVDRGERVLASAASNVGASARIKLEGRVSWSRSEHLWVQRRPAASPRCVCASDCGLVPDGQRWTTWRSAFWREGVGSSGLSGLGIPQDCCQRWWRHRLTPVFNAPAAARLCAMSSVTSRR